MSPKVPKTHLLLRGRSRKAWKMWADSILHFAGMETSPIGAKAHRPPVTRGSVHWQVMAFFLNQKQLGALPITPCVLWCLLLGWDLYQPSLLLFIIFRQRLHSSSITNRQFE